jgi:hypothetical protein
MAELGAFALGTDTELILKSRRVLPGRLSAIGFEFEFPDWPSAARDLVSRRRAMTRKRTTRESPRPSNTATLRA